MAADMNNFQHTSLQPVPPPPMDFWECMLCGAVILTYGGLDRHHEFHDHILEAAIAEVVHKLSKLEQDLTSSR